MEGATDQMPTFTENIPGGSGFSKGGDSETPGAGWNTAAGGGEKVLVDYLEEYALLAIVGLIILYFVFGRVRKGVENVAYEIKSRKAEEAIRRAREAQQAKYWEETAEKREELERIERERREGKLEDMEAMAEGRTSKNKKFLKPKDTRDYWDGKDGFNPLQPGGGGSRYKPSGIQRRGGG